jgi:hypothetical protein
MHDGTYGNPGIVGNLESVTYGFVREGVGSNPTLSAILVPNIRFSLSAAYVRAQSSPDRLKQASRPGGGR